MANLHQFVPTFEPGAVGNHMVELQRLWRESGRGEAEIFSEHGPARRFDEYGTRKFPARPDDVLVYQMAIGSTVADFVRDRPETLVLNHHNLTPVEFLEQWEPTATWGVQWGHAQLRELAARSSLAVAVSRYNAEQLAEAGYRRVEVAPVLVDLDHFQREVEAEALGALQANKAGGGADWLFVGRLAANKCQHDVVRAFALYRAVYDPNARLHLVGGAPADAYRAALDGVVEALGLRGAVSITGSVSPGALSAYYRAADVFVCLSEHEGFCVPLLEAMQNRVPVVAYAAAAVPETLAGGGLLLASKQPTTVAAAVHRVLSDPAVRDGLVAAGCERLQSFTLARSRQRWLDVLAGLS
ncbi:MAG TPA: glycosyltransferase family 4 protein [Acidimicrobiales bacterium]|nr:glycosyltransferase family 4 protein [Acidimicrobiales bacterium]